MNMVTIQRTEERTRIATPKIVLWIGIASIVMLFAGLTSGYIVRQSEGNWIQFRIPSAFYVSTGIIIASSLTMHWALRASRRNNYAEIKRWLIVTLGLGIAFIFCQFFGYNQLMREGIFFTGGNVSGSFFYVITALHAAHVAGGILSLMFTSGKAVLEKYNSENNLGIQVCATYWHFMGILWLYLFVFLAAIR
jgi:cytochrome c oxidase subunit III